MREPCKEAIELAKFLFGEKHNVYQDKCADKIQAVMDAVENKARKAYLMNRAYKANPPDNPPWASAFEKAAREALSSYNIVAEDMAWEELASTCPDMINQYRIIWLVAIEETIKEISKGPDCLDTTVFDERGRIRQALFDLSDQAKE